MFLGVLHLPSPMDPEEFAVIVLSRFDDALPGGALRTEGRHERVVLATQHQDIGIRLVKVVLEYGKRRSSVLTSRAPSRSGTLPWRRRRRRDLLQVPGPEQLAFAVGEAHL